MHANPSEPPLVFLSRSGSGALGTTATDSSGGHSSEKAIRLVPATGERKYTLLNVVSNGITAAVLSVLRFDKVVVDGIVHYKLDDEYAVKCLRLERNVDYLRNVKQGLLALNRLRHPHIIAMRDCVEVINLFANHDGSTCPALGVVMDRATQSMHDYLTLLRHKHKELPEDAARWWFQQLVLAVDHCHDRGVAGQSIRPSNILIFKQGKSNVRNIKLSGLGFSRAILQANSESDTSKPSLYLPPECFKPGAMLPDSAASAAQPDRAAALASGHKADVWACGVVLLQMLFPKTFYAHQRKPSNHRWMQELQVGLDSPKSTESMELLSSMLQEDPDQRATIQDVMNHSWFTQKLPEAAVHLNRSLPLQPLVDKERLEQLLDDIIYKHTGVQLRPAEHLF